MTPLAPILTTSLFRPLLEELLSLLRALDAEQWQRPTVAGAWRVRDVAAHLLDGDLRKLAAYRDAHTLAPDAPIGSERDLVRFVNALNAAGVGWAARLSPRLIVDLLAVTGAWVADLLESLPPHGPALWPVSWAGEGASENWMDTAREYTERWHHQMQIRDAVGAAPTLLAPRWMAPLLDASVRALPNAYAPVDAPAGTEVAFEVAGPTSGAWTLRRDAAAWTLHAERSAGPRTVVRATSDAAWRLLYNALPDPARADGISITGDPSLAAPLLRARSVIV